MYTARCRPHGSSSCEHRLACRTWPLTNRARMHSHLRRGRHPGERCTPLGTRDGRSRARPIPDRTHTRRCGTRRGRSIRGARPDSAQARTPHQTSASQPSAAAHCRQRAAPTFWREVSSPDAPGAASQRVARCPQARARRRHSDLARCTSRDWSSCGRRRRRHRKRRPTHRSTRIDQAPRTGHVCSHSGTAGSRSRHRRSQQRIGTGRQLGRWRCILHAVSIRVGRWASSMPRPPNPEGMRTVHPRRLRRTRHARRSRPRTLAWSSHDLTSRRRTRTRLERCSCHGPSSRGHVVHRT